MCLHKVQIQRLHSSSLCLLQTIHLAVKIESALPMDVCCYFCKQNMHRALALGDYKHRLITHHRHITVSWVITCPTYARLGLTLHQITKHCCQANRKELSCISVISPYLYVSVIVLVYTGIDKGTMCLP